MQDFDSLYAKVVPPILNSIFKDTYIGGLYEVDHNRHFVDILKKIAGLEARITEGKLNHNFPQASFVSLHAKRLGFSVRAQATEFTADSSDKMLHIKARGEFLERLSVSMPLDVLMGNNFDSEKTAREFSRQIRAKKMFGFGAREVNSAQVYYSLYKTASFQEERLSHQPTSNGCAGHFDYRRASLNGLLELIQRDAFLVHWLNTISPKKISVEQCTSYEDNDDCQALRKLIADCSRYNIECYFLDITSDIAVPAVCCAMVMDSPTGKRMYLGGGAGFNGVAALLSAAGEAATNASVFYFKDSFVLTEQYIPFVDKSIGREERLSLYTTDVMFERARFFVANKETVSFEDWEGVGGVMAGRGFTSTELARKPRKALAYLKEIFYERAARDSQYEVLVYRVKNALLKQFDYKVVRVICDGLYSLYLNENNSNPEHPRLKEFVKNRKLDLIARQNIWPHPFP